MPHSPGDSTSVPTDRELEELADAVGRAKADLAAIDAHKATGVSAMPFQARQAERRYEAALAAYNDAVKRWQGARGWIS